LTCVYTNNTHTHTHAHTHARMHTHTRTHTRTRARTHTHVRRHARTLTHTNACFMHAAVREALSYSALLRLPSSMEYQDKVKHYMYKVLGTKCQFLPIIIEVLLHAWKWSVNPYSSSTKARQTFTLCCFDSLLLTLLCLS
jgi:hypothetical protein